MPIKQIVAALMDPDPLITAKYAVYLAKQMKAKLTGIYVVDEKVLNELLHSRVFVESEAQEYARDVQSYGERFIARMQKMSETKGVEFEGLLLKGEVHTEIIKKAAELGADLLVMNAVKELSSRKEIFYDEGELLFRKATCTIVMVRDSETVKKLYEELE